jgi:hypothetical protein
MSDPVKDFFSDIPEVGEPKEEEFFPPAEEADAFRGEPVPEEPKAKSKKKKESTSEPTPEETVREEPVVEEPTSEESALEESVEETPSRKKRVVSEETKAKLREKMLGFKHTDETKKKISERMRARNQKPE